MSERMRIGLACFIGATIGAFIALEIHRYFWWVGVLLGGGTGYIAYRFENVCMALRDQFVGFKMSLRENKEALVAALAVMGLCYALGSSLVVIAETGRWLLTGEAGGIFDDLIVTWILPSIVSAVVGICLLSTSKRTGEKIASVAVVLLGPGLLLTVVPIATLSGAVYYCARCFRKVFLAIHSEMRLLCMTDAMIGAVAGYFYGSAIAGGIVGALFGVLNYEIVSVRWLKLVPANGSGK